MKAKVKRLWVKVRELSALVIGGASLLSVISVAALTGIVSAAIVFVVKLANLPLACLASIIYPDERHVFKRIREDVVQWWRTLA